MKNFQMIKMADKFRKAEERKSSEASAASGSANKFAPMAGGRFEQRSSTLTKKMSTGIADGGVPQSKSAIAPLSCLDKKQLDREQAMPQQDLCPIHGKPLDVICVTCKERTCSNCALFGAHKGHDVRPEQEVLD